MVGGGRVHDRGVLDALESFEPQALDATVWRVARRGRDPLRGAIANGRWNAIGEFEVLYTALNAEGALAEVGYRLTLEPVWPSQIKHDLHALRIRAGRLLKFDGLKALAGLGVDVEKFGSFDYEATQAIAAAAHFLEFEGLIVPSARFEGSNAVLFLDRMQTQPELLKTDSIDWRTWRSNRR
jgi:RES domain-containing protein